MKTEQVLQRLNNAVAQPTGEIILKKADAKLLLERVNYLESIAASLLRSQNDSVPFVVPFRAMPK